MDCQVQSHAGPRGTKPGGTTLNDIRNRAGAKGIYGLAALVLRLGALDQLELLCFFLLVALLKLKPVLDDTANNVVAGHGVAAVDGAENATLFGHVEGVAAVHVWLGGGSAMHNDVDFEVIEQRGGDSIGCPNDHLVHILASQDAEGALVQIHDGIVLPLVALLHRVRPDPDDQKLAELLCLLEGVDVADVEEIKRSRHVDDSVTGLGLTALGELNDTLGGGQELGHPGPGRGRAVALAQRLHILGQHRRVGPVLRPRHQEHAADEIGGGDTLRALALTVAASILDNLVSVMAIRRRGDIIAMDAKVTAILVQGLERGDIGSPLHHLIHPLASTDHLVPLFLRHDRRALVRADLLIGVDAHNKIVAHELGLAQAVGMPKVHHIIAAIAPHAHLA
eukprot:m.97768 g.97768  ORF g.97768 m.97768 type:complete len:394 (+) comp13989_c1_seq5:650-1831(+)